MDKKAYLSTSGRRIRYIACPPSLKNQIAFNDLESEIEKQLWEDHHTPDRLTEYKNALKREIADIMRYLMRKDNQIFEKRLNDKGQILKDLN